MINVICVKWGTKYSASDVNRLKRNVERYLTIPHKFICYTEDPKDLECDTISIPLDNDLEIYWNKLAMFQKDFVTGTCLYFDIDVVIQNNINHITDYLSDNLTMIRAYWKGNLVTDGSSHKEKERWDMYVNSSCLLWKGGSLGYIWDYFDENADYYMIKYKGIDRFLFHEGFSLKFFPQGLMYSRLCGISEENIGHTQRVRNKIKNKDLPYDELDLFYKEDALVCMFNGPTEDWMYDEFAEHYR
jgi:hypothetical protein